MIRAGRQLRLSILFALAVGPLFGASSINWTAPSPATSPAARSDSAMVYDSVHHQTVLFGGYSSVVKNDTWLWDGANWTQAMPATSPPARAGHAMAYDSVRQQVVLFGGYNNNFADLNDTWVWDGTNWTQKSPTANPAARQYHSMMFDAARSQVVLFGGKEAGTDVNDTWVWDGTNWTQKSLTTNPSARSQSGFVFDSTHSLGVLFGGQQGFESGLGDTWVWNGTAWTQRTPAASPNSRGAAGMVYDSARGLVVLFGGEDFAEEGTPLGDTWYYDNTTWSQATTQASPSARIGPAMAYDALNAQTVLFGGQAVNNTTWLLSALTVLPKSLPDATQGTNYNVQYSADGGVPYYNFSVSGLPPGLSVSSGNLIVGQCTGQSSTGVTISVTDSASPIASTASVGPIPLHCNPAPVITNASPLPVGTTGVAYSVQFTTNAVYDAPGAAPFTWALTPGTLPTGFALDANGILTGTATTAQTSTFSVRFTDRWGATTTKAFQVSFYAPLVVTNSSLTSGTAGTAYPTTTLTAGGGSGGYVFSVSGLPTGLAVTGSPQVIIGTPTQTGTFNPTITVTDSASETAQKTLSLTIAPSAAITITTASTLPAGHSGQPYSTTIAWTGGFAPYTVTGTGLPSWLTLSNAGVLSGTAPGAGNFSFAIAVHDNQSPTQNTATKSFTINVTAPVITTTSPLPSATVGVAYSDTFASGGGVAPYIYGASGLPGWLSLSSGGVLSGTPPTGSPSSVTFTVQVTDSANSTASGSFSLPITTPASLMFVTTSPLPSATVSAAYSTNFSISGGVSPYTYTATGLPSWLTLSTGGTLSGTPPSSGNTTFHVTATDSASNTVAANFTLPVNAVLTIGTTSPLPEATMGVAYSDTLSASGGTGGYSWSATGLPSWLSISSSGVLSGTPPTATSVSFSVSVTDSSSGTATKMLSLTVASALTIGSASPLPAATLNSPYMYTFSASGGGGGYSWSGSGLPSGFAVNSSGVLTGTPTSTSTLSFTVNVTDSLNNTASKAFSLPVSSAVTITNTSPLASATVGVAYSANFTASGGSGGYSWSATGLPTWLTLTAAGYFSGTPPSAGNVSFMVTVTDSQSHSVTGTFTLPVDATLTIGTTSPLSAATVGAQYSVQLTASGGSGSYTWSSTMLPSWLTLTSGGVLSGTPPSATTVSFTATVTDTLSNTASRSFTLAVNSAVTISTASPLPAATVGVAYTAQFAASGGTNSYSWVAASLPSWLSMSSGGLLSGTPPTTGTVTFTATATDTQSHSGTGTFMLPVNSALTIGTTSPLTRAVVGTAYSLQFSASGGTAPYTWAASSLPQWLSITSGGFLTGTPPSAASATFGVTVTDAQSHTATGTFTLPVDPALAFTSTSPLPTATIGVSYSFQFAAAGGSGSYTWGASSLPSWATFNSAGMLAGTPPAGAASATFPVTVFDADGQTRTANFTLPVATQLAIATNSPLPAATVGVAYSAQFAAAGGSGAYSWSGASLPSWLNLSSGGALSGTPPSAGTVTFTVTVIDSQSQSVSKSFSLTSNSALTITTASPLPTATVGAAYTAQFAASGGSGTYSWSGASLPSWLNLSSGGALSGTPPSAGTVTFMVTATDTLSQSVSKSFSLTSNSALTITTVSPLPTATVSAAYTTQFAASGGSGAYSWSGSSLPSWLTVSSSGVLSGTPPSAGTVTLSVTATDTLSQSVTKSFSLTSNSALTITAASPLPAGTVGVSYTAQFAASGGSGTYTWSGASLPSWLTVSSGGALSGTPPNAATVTFSVTVTDSQSQSVTKSFSLTSNSALTITTASPLPAGTVGVTYSAHLAASGGSGTYTWSGSSLPSWLAVSSSGVLSGTPPSSGTVTFSVTATDTLSQSVTKSFSLTSNSALTITTASPLLAGTVGAAYSAQFAASGGSGSYSWSGSSLPSWLTVSSSGSLSGTPPSAGTVTFSITATDTLSQSVTKSFSLTSNSALTITTASPLPTATVGAVYSAQFAASGGSGTYSWSGASLPSWLTVSSGGALSGTPPSSGTVTFSVTATDTLSQSVTKSFSLTSNSALTITTASPLLAGTVGAAYSAQFAASGGSGSYSWSGASLPSWLTVSSGGVLSGTPPSSGTVTFSITVTDTLSQSVTKSFSLTSNSALTITTASPLPAGTVGVAYTAQFAASGGSGTYSWSGASLPSWLTVSSGGVLSGTPPSSGTVTFSITVTDTLSQSVTKSFSLTSNSALTITTASPLPAGTVGVAYTAQFAASGGSGTYSWSGASLPSWLTISSGGALSGTPPSSGTVTFSITATDTLSQSVTRSFSLTSNSALTITTASPLPAGTVGAAYSAQFAASGGSGTYTWSGSSLPSWLAVSSSGALSGTPPSGGTVTFSVTATDTLSQSVTKSFSLTSNSALTITTASSLPAATVGTAYSVQFAATGGSGTYSWSGASLPSWLTVSSGGALSGTPPSAGTVTFSVTVIDSQSQSVTKSFSLSSNSALTITTASPLPAGTMGVSYTAQFVASGGSGVYTWSGSSLPSWLTVASNGLLSGTPPSAGTVTFSVTAMDTLSHSVSKSFTLTSNAALTITNTSPLPAATLGTAYTAQFTASGGSGTYSWSGASLPTWLTVSSGGLLSGTPPNSGSVTFAVTATDTLLQAVTKTFTLPVNAAVTITNTSPLPAATVGTAYSEQLAASGGSGFYTWSGASLPAWLTIASNGLLSGTPPSAGSATFAITATDSLSQAVTKSFTLQSNAALTITNASPLASASVGSAYTAQFAASGGMGPYTWSGSQLPAWLTVSSSGLLSGTPPSAASVTFSIRVTDSLLQSVGKSFTLQANAAVTITNTSPLPAATAGVGYSAQFSASGGSGIYSWSGAQLPAWLTLSSNGVLSGTPPGATTVTFLVTATDSLSQAATKSFTLQSNTTLTITNTSPLPAATVGAIYTAQFAATGGSGNYTWAGSQLPTWLTLASNGLLSGTPPSSGNSTFTVTVFDYSLQQSVSNSFTLQANAPLTVTTVSPLLAATVGVPYSVQLTAAGGLGTYTWIGETLPNWLTVSSTGLLSGTPPSAGLAAIYVDVADAVGQSAGNNLNIPINSVLTITTSSPLPTATAGVAYSAQIMASGGSGIYLWSGNSLPSWLTISSSGVLSGTPPGVGTVQFSVTASDYSSEQAVSKSFTLQSVSALTITTASPLPTATVGTAYTAQFAASGGSGTYSWSGSSLPSWLTVSSGGRLSGTPPSAGTVAFSVTVSDSLSQVTKSFTLTSNAALTITTTSPLPAATVGAGYTAQFAASGGSGSYLWSGSSLPSWLTVSSGGQLTGTPPSAGMVTFQVTASDYASQQSVSKSFTLQSVSALTITTASPLPTATVGAVYSAQFAASGGSGSYSWSGSSLPSWLTVSSGGQLTGTPPSAGTVTFQVTAADTQLQQSVSKSFSLTSNSALTITSASPLPAGTVGIAYTAQFAASGGSGSYSWSGSSLPSWLTVSSGGQLTGTPPSAGTVSFQVTVSDSVSQVTKSFALTSNATLTITTASPLPAGTVGVAYAAQFAASGGSGSYSWSGSLLPSWLTVSSGGQLTGTPPSAGTVTFQVTAADTQLQQSVSKSFSLTSNSLSPATVGVAYTAQFAASGGSGSYSWSGSSLPAWLTVSSSGQLSGTPPSAGMVTFQITASDYVSQQSVSKSFTLTSNSALTITTASPLSPDTVDVAYTAQFAASGGSGNYSWSGSSLPCLADCFFGWPAIRARRLARGR